MRSFLKLVLLFTFASHSAASTVTGLRTHRSQVWAYDFTVATPINYTFDMLARESGNIDLFANGTADLMDPVLSIFNSAGTLIHQNDDSNETFGDGSVHRYDSYLNVDLTSGDYTVGVSSYPYARGISNLTLNAFFALDDGFDVGENFNWQLTTNTQLTTALVSAVPVPAAIWFMGSGLLGLMGFSRKNKAQSVVAA